MDLMAIIVFWMLFYSIFIFVGVTTAYGQMVILPSDQLTLTSILSNSAPSNEPSAVSWTSNVPLTTSENASIGDGTPLENPFANDVIKDDGDEDGYSMCDDPILQIKVQCPVGWELDEEEDSISFNVAEDFYTYIIIEKQHIFPIDNTADYMRDILNLERNSGNLEIIDLSETSINGMQAHRAEYNTTSFKTIQYFIVDEEEYLGYIIELTSDPEDFNEYVPTFERVASTFEITK
jgi:hypothetical protein